MNNSDFKIAFVGAFNITYSEQNPADSAAANQVQMEILEELKKEFPTSNLIGIVLRPVPSWPNGPLIHRCTNNNNIRFPKVINLPLIKTILFSCQLFIQLIKERPTLIVKYNIFFSEVIAIRLLRIFSQKPRVALIIQDVKYPQIGLRRPLGYLEYLAAHLSSRFDFLFPVSKTIADDFGFDKSKTLVFRGGISRQTRAIIAMPQPKVQGDFRDRKAVFAGALEPYNGIDCLARFWADEKVPNKLMIYGTGSMLSYIECLAADCPNIEYVGYKSENEVASAIASADINFCLRYPRGINDKYFFPSKFFNISAAGGYAICNRFENFPIELADYFGIINDDLSNLLDLINLSLTVDVKKCRAMRIEWLMKHCQWSTVVSELRKGMTDK